MSSSENLFNFNMPLIFSNFDPHPLIPMHAITFTRYGDSMSSEELSQYNNELSRLISSSLSSNDNVIFLSPQQFNHYDRLISPIFRNNEFIFPDSVFDPNSRFNIQLKSEKYTGDDCLCSLCLDDIKNEADIYKLPCNHIFHAHNCLENTNVMNWIEQHETCPYCRGKVNVFNPHDEEGLDPEEITIVMSQAGVSREKAVAALRKHRNVVDAILECTD